MTRKIICLAAFAYIMISFLIMFSCANQVSPTGGKKDVTPPKVLATIPLNSSVNFTGKKIIIKFDEFVQLDNPFNQVVISPPLEKFPDLYLKGKSLVITFKETLKPNSTYSINLGNAIKDITEGNIMKDYSFVFSTGPELDSLKIGGMVVDAEKNQPVEDIIVALYKDLNDSVVYKHKPYYFGRTDKLGVFKIQHIQEGTYKLFALKDANFNLIYDQLSESIAYWDVPIQISNDSTSKKNYRLVIFTEKTNKLRLDDASSKSKETNQYIFSAPIEKLKVVPLDTNKNMKGDLFEWNPTRDTITQWITYSVLNPKLIIIANDTVKDTVSLKRPDFTTDSIKKTDKLTFTSSVKVRQDEQTQNLYLPLTLDFNRPIGNIDTSKIFVYMDSTWNNRITAPVIFMDSVHRKIGIDAAWKADYWYSLYLQKGAFKDIYYKASDNAKIRATDTAHYRVNDTTRYKVRDSTGYKVSDSTRYIFHIMVPEDFGTLNLVIEKADPLMQYIVSLSDDKGTLIDKREVSVLDTTLSNPPALKSNLPQVINAIGNDSISIHYSRLEPGNYGVKIILDKNHNGKWDSGSYRKKRQPESVYVHPTPITIRANWDVRQEIEMK